MAHATRKPAEPLIRKTPGVMGGAACLRRTRIPVWILVRWRQLGLDDAAILAGYPDLTAEDLAAAWAFYATAQDEVDAAIVENEGE